jgi:OOP family OmpA-OmpF porin
MKKYVAAIAAIVTIGISMSSAQLVKDYWIAGLGLTYPQYHSVNITSLYSNYGAYFIIQRNVSEHVGLRLKGSYSNLEGQWTDPSLGIMKETTNLITDDLDLLYYPVPCSPVSPYVFAGIGGNYKSIINGQTPIPNNNKFGSQLNAGTGAEFKFHKRWSLVTEISYHMTNSSELEGTIVPGEINGHDSYIVLSAGVNFRFGKGKPSKLCEPCTCMVTAPENKDMVDYSRIEKMIVKHIPKEIATDRYIMAASNDRLVLVGVNFAFDKSELLPESYPVLDKSVVLLNDKPDVKFEVEGYTDYVGTDTYNQELSVERAQTVKAYLVSKGIAQNRLTTVGFGKNNPIENNDTEEGRAMNRRIVFKMVR